MNKRIFNFLLVLAGCLAITGSCKKEDSGIPYTYTSQVTVGANSTLDGLNGATSNAAKYQIELLFSTDNGTTWTEYPMLKPGQSYMVSLYHSAWGTGLTSDINLKTYTKSSAFDFDWTGSKPGPSTTSGSTATFALAGSNLVKVNIADHHCSTDLTAFADGSGWAGVRGSSQDISLFTIDPSISTRLWITNILGRGQAVKGYLDFSTSTSFFDQTVNVPSQTTSDLGTLVGSGTYDQCRQRLVLNLSYTSAGGTKTTWTYTFTRYFCDYNASFWLGDWKGDETNTTCCGGTDNNKITADPSIPNRFHMDNFFGDGVDAYFDLNSAAKNYWQQTLTLPAQTTSEGGVITAATGTFDQCAGTWQVKCTYKLGASTYVWTYQFHK